MKILAAWLGITDINIARGGEVLPIGPIAQAVAADKYDLLLLLADHPAHVREGYADWLKSVTPISVDIVPTNLTSPTNYRDIYEAASAALDEVSKKHEGKTDLTLHLSPGTPAMAAIWIILGRTKHPAQLIQSSVERGVEPADVPFEIAVEFIPDLVRSADAKRRENSDGRAPIGASFGDILYRSKAMEKVINDAAKTALRNLPVLIEGESGTGKELLARAIHNNSPRSDIPLTIVNCGAIPSELIESEFFGHKKGAFTGAISDQEGAFQTAHGGTLFLDEIGELPKASQVTLLRVLQDGEVKRIGDNKPRIVDVRVIAATNRNLIADVASGKFREDLYYRLAVITLKLPPLREREGDLLLLADELLEMVNNDAKDEPGYERKQFSIGAKNLVLSHTWPGNVRELLNTLRRVTLFSDGERISEMDMRLAIEPVIRQPSGDDEILNRPITEGVNLNEIIRTVAKHYLERAMKETGGNKVKAAKLVGLTSYQTLTNWLSKHEVQKD